MEILDMTIAGVRVGTLLLIAGCVLFIKSLYEGYEGWKKGRKERAKWKEDDRRDQEEFIWKEEIIGGWIADVG